MKIVGEFSPTEVASFFCLLFWLIWLSGLSTVRSLVCSFCYLFLHSWSNQWISYLGLHWAHLHFKCCSYSISIKTQFDQFSIPSKSAAVFSLPHRTKSLPIFLRKAFQWDLYSFPSHVLITCIPFWWPSK